MEMPLKKPRETPLPAETFQETFQMLYTVELEAQPVRVGFAVPTKQAPILLHPPLPPAMHTSGIREDLASHEQLQGSAGDTAQSNGDVHIATMQYKDSHGNADSHEDFCADFTHNDSAVDSAVVPVAGERMNPAFISGMTMDGEDSDATKEAAMNGAQADQAMVDNAAMIGAEATSVAATAGIPIKVALADTESAAAANADSADVSGADARAEVAETGDMQLRVPDAASFPEPVCPGTIPVVGAAIMRDGKILCARRPFDKNLGGKWEFPGGKVKPGETYREALAREIREELGCEVEVGDQVCTTLNTYRFGTISLVTFRCTLKPGEEPKRLEHLKLRWMDPLDMPSLDWAPADCEAVDLISIESQG